MFKQHRIINQCWEYKRRCMVEERRHSCKGGKSQKVKGRVGKTPPTISALAKKKISNLFPGKMAKIYFPPFLPSNPLRNIGQKQ